MLPLSPVQGRPFCLWSRWGRIFAATQLVQAGVSCRWPWLLQACVRLPAETGESRVLVARLAVGLLAATANLAVSDSGLAVAFFQVEPIARRPLRVRCSAHLLIKLLLCLVITSPAVGAFRKDRW